jgi:hypothetical protein
MASAWGAPPLKLRLHCGTARSPGWSRAGSRGVGVLLRARGCVDACPALACVTRRQARAAKHKACTASAHVCAMRASVLAARADTFHLTCVCVCVCGHVWGRAGAAASNAHVERPRRTARQQHAPHRACDRWCLLLLLLLLLPCTPRVCGPAHPTMRPWLCAGSRQKTSTVYHHACVSVCACGACAVDTLPVFVGCCCVAVWQRAQAPAW